MWRWPWGEGVYIFRKHWFQDGRVRDANVMWTWYLGLKGAHKLVLTSSGPSHATFCGWYFNWKLLASSGDPNVSSLTPEADNIWVSDGDTEAFDAEGTDTRADNFETTDTEFNVPDNFDNNIEYMEKLISDSDRTVNIYI